MVDGEGIYEGRNMVVKVFRNERGGGKMVGGLVLGGRKKLGGVKKVIRKEVRG